MSKFLYICERDKELEAKSIDNLLNTLNDRLLPDNFQARKPKRLINGREAYLLLNPNENTIVKEFNLCQGIIINDKTDWYNVNNVPEGNFSIIRTNSELTEVLTDPVASYTIWYYFGKKLFLASSSQRAIIFYLGSFEFNDKVIPWMLSAGILGPDQSWDKRLMMVPGNTSLILDKNNWKLNEIRHEFKNQSVERKNAEEYLRKSIYEIVDRIDLNYDKWILPLSGGGDSRLLLSLMCKKKNLKTITWGTRQAMENESTDASVAKRVAEFFQVSNQYYILNETDLNASSVLHRILVAGEGRTDTIGGYIDGFQLWKDLFESDIQGIIRGDHGFCTRSPLKQTNDGFRWGTFKLLSDFKEYEEIIKYIKIDQNFPDSFNRKIDESLEQWEIRLRLTFSFPYLMSALNDLKLAYLDVFSPMLCKSVIEAVLNCPDVADKRFIKNFNKEIGPDLPMASSGALASDSQILGGNSSYITYIRSYLNNRKNQTVINPEFIDYILEKQKNNLSEVSVRKKIKKWLKYRFKYLIPYGIKNELIARFDSPSFNFHILALRVFIILRMNEILREDSGFPK